MSIQGFGGLSAPDVHPVQGVACVTGSSHTSVITLTGLLVACVVNGDTISSVLHQAAWLVVAITILILVQLIAARCRPARPAGSRFL
ncbi:hypothetical protein JK361_10455 [Streptomyces sp. 5-8]|uniref:Uncharacterized protein n=1 Tax=Streptomyces musisoli TaxID=2802280 RepID=A0ABS1NYT0_9ACTN|nr:MULTISPECIES: hypothetical protein [Streptomyces]MBL1105007.1 hypothetical protein [Streptomyces musisoli]MBY8841095.1 hypothetical protein [Streptomyces sp. SP2-10]